MNSVIDANYALHPNFKFQVWLCNSPAIRSLDQMFAQNMDRGFKCFNQRVFQAEIKQLFSELFEELRGAHADRHWELFLKEVIANCERLYIAEFLYYSGMSKVPVSPSKRALLDEFSTNKYILGNLDTKTLEALKIKIEHDVNLLFERHQKGASSREQLTISSGSTIRSIVKILNSYFSESGVLEVLSSYCGRDTQVVGCGLELSPPNEWWKNRFSALPRPPRSLYAHLDESRASPKAIIYLTDTVKHNGATSVYPGVYENCDIGAVADFVGKTIGLVGRGESPLQSLFQRGYHQVMDCSSFRALYGKLPTEMRFNSHIGWDVFPGSDLEQMFSDAEHVVEGDMGKFLCFSGAELFHRGGIVEKDSRVALQVVFGGKPSIHSKIYSRVLRTLKQAF